MTTTNIRILKATALNIVGITLLSGCTAMVIRDPGPQPIDPNGPANQLEYAEEGIVAYAVEGNIKAQRAHAYELMSEVCGQGQYDITREDTKITGSMVTAAPIGNTMIYGSSQTGLHYIYYKCHGEPKPRPVKKSRLKNSRRR